MATGYSLDKRFFTWKNGGKSKCILYFLKEECHTIFDLHIFLCAVQSCFRSPYGEENSFQVYFQRRWAHVPTMPSHPLCPPLLDFVFVFPITAFQGSRSFAQLSSKFCFAFLFCFPQHTIFSNALKPLPTPISLFFRLGGGGGEIVWENSWIK